MYDCFFVGWAFFATGVMFKVVPLILLCLLVGRLIVALRRVEKRRVRLLTDGKRSSATTDRTTKMLIAIVCVVFTMELPQGVMTILGALYNEAFQVHIYRRFGDFLDTMSLLQSTATFIIYCSTSELFRQEFRSVFLPKRFSDRYVRVVHRRSELPDIRYDEGVCYFMNTYKNMIFLDEGVRAYMLFCSKQLIR
jgi:hypothetical protein